jgi:hypothetical protein
MKFAKCSLVVLLAAAIAAAIIGWKRVQHLQSEVESLRADAHAAQEQAKAAAEVQTTQTDEELGRLRAQAQEIPKLRGEVSRLRLGVKEAEKLRAENQKLRESLQASAVAALPAPTTPGATDQFPRATWTFSGYATPDAALVSAIWAMREGKPQTYLESLSLEERERLIKGWQNKSEAEIIAKHQQDVASITGIRVLERQAISENEMLMNVYVEGPGRLEKVSLKRIGDEWKFGGYIRDQAK